MKDNKFFDQIENAIHQIKEAKNRTWDRIALEIDYSEKKEKRFKLSTFKWISLATAVLIICLIIPIATILIKPTQNNLNRFCRQDEYFLQISEFNITALSEQYENLLHFNWAESESTTNFYVDKNDETITLGIDEVIYNPETDTEYKIDVVFPNYIFEEFETLKQDLTNTVKVEGINVLWVAYQSSAYIMFEYKNYTYCLNMIMEINEDYVKTIVNELLNSDSTK